MDGGKLVHSELTEGVLAGAFEVHRHLGPGLLESAYRECLVRELSMRGFGVECEVPIPIIYKELRIEGAYRADMVIDQTILLEIKAVERIMPVHEAQTLTYLKLSKAKVALLLNFNTRRLQHGIRRFVA